MNSLIDKLRNTDPLPEEYMPKRAAIAGLNAVERAITTYIKPKPLPDYSGDAIALAIREAGRALAEDLRNQAKRARADGERRGLEYDNMADVVEDKAIFQANQAIEFVDWIEGFKKKGPSNVAMDRSDGGDRPDPGDSADRVDDRE